MLIFFLRKSLYTGWDNAFMLVAFNAVLVAIAALGILIPFRLETSWLVALRFIFMGLAGSWWYATVTRVSALVSSHQSVSFADMAKAARDSLVPGLQFFCLASLCVAALTVAVPFYAAIGGFWGTLATSFSVWILAAFVLILQYFLPAGATARVGFKDSLRISVALFFDAPFFSLGLAAYGIGCVALSPVLAFLLPGPAAAALAGSVATGIRMRKLRWLQANCGTPPGPAPWNELLSDDIEAVGVRSIKDFVFPWRH